MKILQIGDLHIGKTVNGFSMLDDQKHILKQVLETLEREAIDVLVVCGDIYDRPLAPVDGVEVWSDFLEQLTNLNIEAFMINGNHDSLKRLNFASKIFEQSNIHIVSDSILYKKYSVENVDFYLLPYLSLEQASSILDTKVSSFDQLKSIIIESIELNPVQTNIIVDHSYIITGEHDIEQDSAIRPLSLGGSEFTDGSVYADFDLVLAGHIHRHSHIRPNIYYSGSILPYSIGERNNKNGYYIHDINNTITSNYYNFELLHQIREVKLFIDDIESHTYSDDYIVIKLLDEGKVINPLERLRNKYPNIMQIDRNFRNLELDQFSTDSQQSIENSFVEFYNLNSENQISDESLDYFKSIVNQVVESERNETD